jgi:ElaB/YqjD/DUF883 family membrane-anchored ribosome-binding protein
MFFTRRLKMETIYEGGNSDPRNSKQRVKGELSDAAQAAKDSASAEFKSFVADIEDVIKRVANVSDVEVARVRAKVQAALANTKSDIVSSAAGVKQQAERAARYTDEYVHESPWQAIGFGAAVAAVLGLSIGLLSSRRH